MLTSLDGIHWERSSIQTVQPQQVKLAFATATPESPPYPGASAVIGAVVADGAIHATGWVTIEGRITGVVWTFDGSTWTETCPSQSTGWDRVRRSNRRQRIRSNRGPRRSDVRGPGTLISDGSNEWTRVDRGVDATGQESGDGIKLLRTASSHTGCTTRSRAVATHCCSGPRTAFSGLP